MDPQVSPKERVLMRRFLLIAIPLMLLLVSCGGHEAVTEDGSMPADAAEIRYEYGIPVDSFYIVEDKVGNGESLGKIFHRAGVPAPIVAQLSSLSSEDFDVRQLRVGKTYLFFYPIAQSSQGVDTIVCGQDSVAHAAEPEYFVYRKNMTEDVVFHLTDSLHAEKQVRDVIRRPRRDILVIESSLWQAAVGQGLSPELVLELSEVYAWTIDFFGLQKGDSISVYYEELYVDTTLLGVGKIYASHFFASSVPHRAYLFDSESMLDSADVYVNGYFDENGKNLKKAFLKAPLNYKRISSTFTYARKHPIYKTVRPHTGVDYAAPMGTPVVALGDGKVIEKGYKGGGGNTVKIRHNSTYTTAYLHLSKYGKGINVGTHVKQGQVIGYVGSTGASTGPHLDFRVWKNGTPVNPLTLESPSAEPVPDGCMSDYLRQVARMDSLLR